MIRQSARTGRTFSTSSIQREVIQAQGHTGSNQNCTFSRTSGCAVTLAGNRRPHSPIPRTCRAGRRRCSPEAGRGDAGAAPTRDGETPLQPRRGTGLPSGPSRGCLAARRCDRLGSAARPGLEVEDHGGAVVAHEPAGFSRALPRGRVQEREGGRLAVRAGEVLVLPGLLGAVAQAARLQPEQPRGAVAARGDAGLAAPLPERLIQEVDGGLRAVRGGELRRLPGLLGAVAQAAWLQADQPRGAVVAQRRGGLAAPLPQRLVQERDAVSLPVGGGELPGLPGLLPAVAQAAPPQPEQGGGAVIAEGRAGLTAPPPPRLRPQEYAGP